MMFKTVKGGLLWWVTYRALEGYCRTREKVTERRDSESKGNIWKGGWKGKLSEDLYLMEQFLHIKVTCARNYILSVIANLIENLHVLDLRCMCHETCDIYVLQLDKRYVRYKFQQLLSCFSPNYVCRTVEEGRVKLLWVFCL